MSYPATALGTNIATVNVTLVDYPDVLLQMTIELQVDCPDFHTLIWVIFNNTFVEIPTIYYEVDANAPLVFPLNQWALMPESGKPRDITCFSVTGHQIRDVATGLDVSHIQVTDFSQGMLELYTSDTSLSGQTIRYEWIVHIDDGTTENIMTFDVIYKSLMTCDETTLE